MPSTGNPSPTKPTPFGVLGRISARMRIGRKLSLAFILTAILAGTGIGVTNYTIARESLLTEARKHLLVLAQARQAAISEFLHTLGTDISYMATSFWIQDAVVELQTAWGELNGWTRERFIRRRMTARQLRQTLPENAAADTLEQVAALENLERLIFKFGPELRGYAQTRGFTDLYVIGSDGSVVFSATRRDLLGRNLREDDLAERPLARAFFAALEQHKRGLTALTDFSADNTITGAPTAFLSDLITGEGRTFLGALILEIPIDRFSEVTHQASGLGERGDVVLVGPDELLRSNSRLTSTSTLLDTKVSTPAVREALAGERVVAETDRGYTDPDSASPERVLAAFVPIKYGDQTWAVMASVPLDELLEPVANMRLLSLGGGAAILALVLLASLGIAGSITRPIRDITDVMLRLAGNDVSARVPHLERNDELGWMAGALEIFRQNVIRIEQLRAEIDRERQLLDRTFHAMTQGIAVFDGGDRLKVFNERFIRLLNLNEEKVGVGAGRAQLMVAEMRDGVGEPPREADQDIQPLSIAADLFTAELDENTERVRHAASGRYISINRFPLASGGRVLVFTDLTDRIIQEHDLRVARDAAEQAAQAKAMFLATMSHEIRTPMNGVLSMSALLDQTDLDDDQRSMVSVVRQSADALLTVINDILDFSKIEAGKLDIEAIEMSLVETCESVAELLNLRADEKGVEFALDIAADVPDRVLGDPTRIRQVLFNLTGNAIKFTEAGSVSIHITRTTVSGDGGGEDGDGEDGPRDMLRFEIRDTGIGLTPDQQARLFKPFSQADGSTARRFGGTGLGLSICLALCKLMGGAIGVESVAGEGSTFWFTMPLTPAEGGDSAFTPSVAGARVLCVGQPPITRAALVTAATRVGAAKVEAASTMEEVFARFSANGDDLPNILMVDADLTGHSARALLESLLEWAGERKPEVVLTCDRGLASTLLEAERAGYFATLTHPIRRERLHRIMAAALGLAPKDVRGAADGPLADAWTAPDVEAARAAGALILVAEDNPTNQVVLKRILDRAGIAHEFADDGAIALSMIKRDAYSLLLTDFHMPNMDGFELTAAVREREARETLPRLPIVALTADALPGTRDKCLEAEMDDYLTKPIEIDRLMRIIERYVPAALELRTPAITKSRHVGTSTEPTGGPADVFAATLAAIDGEVLNQPRLVETFGAVDQEAIVFVAGFIERADELIVQIMAAFAAEDIAEARHVVHALKGGALSVGADRLGRIAGDIQDLIDGGDTDTAPLFAEALAPTLDELRSALAPILSSTPT